MATSIKRILVGNALKTEQAQHERLAKKTALAVFSSDALSSVAYSTEAILLVLLAAGTLAAAYLIPISIGIVVLLGILTLSYRQTIHAYPSGGGAYIVAKDNLGTRAGLIAGASLLVDYILTVAVSISAGVAAITSATQGTRLDFLHEHRVFIGLFFIMFIALVNLRGVKESGAIFAGPTYLFIFAMLALIGVGFYRYFTTGSVLPTPDTLHFDDSGSIGNSGASALTGGGLIWLLMRAFASGCTALTGVEAISNGIPAFKKPESKNAATTLTVMAIVMSTLIIGTGVLAYKINAHPLPDETLVSAMARHTFGSGFFYYFIQGTTAAILVLAANTAFADFPRLSSLLAADRFLPRQFANRGDRLVFSNGVLILAFFAALLVVIFGGEEQALLPLYAVGVFLSFTLSQSGMVVHWLRERRAAETKKRIITEAEANPRDAADPLTDEIHARERLAAIENDEGKSWLLPTLINCLGAVITFVVLVVIATTKFTHGAWAVIVLIPLLVLLFRAIHTHYAEVARQLSTEGLQELKPIKNTVLVPISGIHRGVINALQYAKAISPDNVTAVYIDLDEDATQKLKERWEQWGSGIKLVVLQSPYRSLTRPLVRYINKVDKLQKDDVVTVILPEFVPAKWWHQLLHNQSSLLLKGALLFKRNVIVTSVPYHLEH